MHASHRPLSMEVTGAPRAAGSQVTTSGNQTGAHQGLRRTRCTHLSCCTAHGRVSDAAPASAMSCGGPVALTGKGRLQAGQGGHTPEGWTLPFGRHLQKAEPVRTFLLPPWSGSGVFLLVYKPIQMLPHPHSCQGLPPYCTEVGPGGTWPVTQGCRVDPGWQEAGGTSAVLRHRAGLHPAPQQALLLAPTQD